MGEGFFQREKQKSACGLCPRFLVLLEQNAQSAESIARTCASLKAQSYRNFIFGGAGEAGAYDYAFYVEAGDTLAENALERFADAIEQNPDADLFYADELDENGAPVLKNDFDELELLSNNCIGSPMAVKAALHTRAREDAYVRALRCAAQSKSIVHIKQTLYTRHAPPAKGDAHDNAAALEAYLLCKKQNGFVAKGLFEGSYRVFLPPRASMSVGIVIPSTGKLEALRRLLESLEANTGYANYSIAVALRQKAEDGLKTYLELLQKNGAAKIISCYGLSEAAACNKAARKLRVKALLFLSERAELFSHNWLDALAEQLCRPGIGAVGGKSLDKNGRILCAGLGLSGLNPFLGEADDPKSHATGVIRAAYALDGACLLITRGLFLRLRGFDESSPASELCKKLAAKSLKCVYTPFCRVRIHEA